MSEGSRPRQQPLVLKERRGSREEPGVAMLERRKERGTHQAESGAKFLTRSKNSAIALESASEGKDKLDSQSDIPWKMGMNEGREHSLRYRWLNGIQHVKTWMSHRWRKVEFHQRSRCAHWGQWYSQKMRSGREGPLGRTDNSSLETWRRYSLQQRPLGVASDFGDHCSWCAWTCGRTGSGAQGVRDLRYLACRHEHTIAGRRRLRRFWGYEPEELDHDQDSSRRCWGRSRRWSLQRERIEIDEKLEDLEQRERYTAAVLGDLSDGQQNIHEVLAFRRRGTLSVPEAARDSEVASSSSINPPYLVEPESLWK